MEFIFVLYLSVTIFCQCLHLFTTNLFVPFFSEDCNENGKQSFDRICVIFEQRYILSSFPRDNLKGKHSYQMKAIMLLIINLSFQSISGELSRFDSKCLRFGLPVSITKLIILIVCILSTLVADESTLLLTISGKSVFLCCHRLFFPFHPLSQVISLDDCLDTHRNGDWFIVASHW